MRRRHAAIIVIDGGLRESFGNISADHRGARSPAWENSRLRELLGQQTIQLEKPGLKPKASRLNAVAEPVGRVNPELSIPEKIALFRALFRGREDVYATRWEGTNGKAGYSPASIRDWTALRSAAKAEWKKRDKETRQLLPLTEQALHDHLSGKTTIGVYPLLVNETCWFLAVDFDQKTWKQDAAAFVESCREWNVPAALERSRSGNGAHVWIFFASVNRRHVCQTPGRGAANQDHGAAPSTGMGSGPPLPESGHNASRRIREFDRPASAEDPRKSGNSVFLDDSLEPIADQWSYLASIPRMEPLTVQTSFAAWRELEM